MIWRMGRELPRCLFLQKGPQPSDSDSFLGMVESPALAKRVVEAVNGATERAQKLAHMQEVENENSLLRERLFDADVLLMDVSILTQSRADVARAKIKEVLGE